MTVPELLTKISSSEITDWMAYYTLREERSKKEETAEFRRTFEEKVNG